MNLLYRLIFRQLERLSENECFRCGSLIVDAEDLSLDHKTAHQGNQDLFWDLDNLAWSHRRCNFSHGGKIGGMKNRESGHAARLGSSQKGNCSRWKIVRGKPCICGQHTAVQ